VGMAFVNKACHMKTTRKEQGKAIMDVSFVMRVILKAVLQYKDKVLQFKKYMWALHVEVFKRTLSCSC